MWFLLLCPFPPPSLWFCFVCVSVNLVVFPCCFLSNRMFFPLSLASGCSDRHGGRRPAWSCLPSASPFLNHHLRSSDARGAGLGLAPGYEPLCHCCEKHGNSTACILTRVPAAGGDFALFSLPYRPYLCLHPSPPGSSLVRRWAEQWGPAAQPAAPGHPHGQAEG